MFSSGKKLKKLEIDEEGLLLGILWLSWLSVIPIGGLVVAGLVLLTFMSLLPVAILFGDAGWNVWMGWLWNNFSVWFLLAYASWQAYYFKGCFNRVWCPTPTPGTAPAQKSNAFCGSRPQ